MSRRTWLFGYGSLVSPVSLASTIGRRVELGVGMHVAELTGWRRAWNYGSAVLRGDWTLPDGRDVVGGLVVSLGVVADPHASMNGVVFAVDDDELADLDWRERAYDRVDVTDTIVLDEAGRSAVDGPVGLYVPRPEAIARYERHRDAGTAGIRQSYWDLVDAAFADLGPGHQGRYRTTEDPDVPVVDITLDPLPARRPPTR